MNLNKANEANTVTCNDPKIISSGSNAGPSTEHYSHSSESQPAQDQLASSFTPTPIQVDSESKSRPARGGKAAPKTKGKSRRTTKDDKDYKPEVSSASKKTIKKRSPTTVRQTRKAAAAALEKVKMYARAEPVSPVLAPRSPSPQAPPAEIDLTVLDSSFDSKVTEPVGAVAEAIDDSSLEIKLVFAETSTAPVALDGHEHGSPLGLLSSKQKRKREEEAELVPPPVAHETNESAPPSPRQKRKLAADSAAPVALDGHVEHGSPLGLSSGKQKRKREEEAELVPSLVAHEPYESAPPSPKQKRKLDPEAESVPTPVVAPKKGGRKPKVNAPTGFSAEEINDLLTKRNSPLASMSLRGIAPAILERLPRSDMQELSALLPSVDRAEGSLDLVALAGNSYVSDHLETYQDILSLGGFEEKKGKDPEAGDDPPFKDDAYEERWGDRLLRNAAAKEAAAASKRRGRGRGSGR